MTGMSNTYLGPSPHVTWQEVYTYISESLYILSYDWVPSTHVTWQEVYTYISGSICILSYDRKCLKHIWVPSTHVTWQEVYTYISGSLYILSYDRNVKYISGSFTSSHDRKYISGSLYITSDDRKCVHIYEPGRGFLGLQAMSSANIRIMLLA